MNPFIYPQPSAPCQTIADVKQHMLLLTEALRGTDLHNLIAFNDTYYIITKNVYKVFGKQYFSDETAMVALDINFAQYYFDALRDYSEHKLSAGAWTVLFNSSPLNQHYQFMYMALGINAHVNNDLPLSLHSSVSPNFEADFFKVDKIIGDSLAEVIAMLREESRLVAHAERIHW